MRKEIEEIKVKKTMEHRDITDGHGIELVPLMKDKHTGLLKETYKGFKKKVFSGRPHKDPSTGYMMSHGLSSTDVTKLAADSVG